MAATAHTTHSITGDMARGAVAGTAGAWVMSKATRFLQALEDPESQRQEQNAMINGKSAPQIAAERISSRTGMEISAEQVHLAMGALPAAFYGVLIDRVPGMNKGNGLLFGLMLFLLMDELMTPAIGVANKPSAYPWQTHFRGLLGHLVLGAVTYRAFKLLNR